MNYYLLGDVFSSIVNDVVQWFYKLLFQILMWLKDVFDLCYVLVRKLAGIDTYYYNGTAMGAGNATSDTVTGDIIEVMIRSDVVRNLFITLLVLGIILLFIVTFIAVWKTEWEFGKDGNSKTKVINAALKALFNFIAVPVITFFGIFVGSALLRAIDNATAGGTNVTMSDIVITSIATNALRSDNLGSGMADGYTNEDFINRNNSDIPNEQNKIGIYQYFMDGNGEIVSEDILAAFKNHSTIKAKGVYYVNSSGMGFSAKDINKALDNGTLTFSWTNEELVRTFFDPSEFNYVLGYLVLIIMLKTMLEITYGLVKRIFYMIFLFIVSPPIVAMAPVNDKALGEWRKLFVKNAGSAFVTIGIYNIFMSVYPLFDKISFFGSSDKVSIGALNFSLSFLNGFVSLLMVCVGLLVVNEISKAISSLFGVNDLYDQSTDKGKSLWGNAFGLAGKALKPMSIPAKAVGKGAEFVARGAYQGWGQAFKGLGKDAWSGIKSGAGKIANAGPLSEMWAKAGTKDVIGQFKKNKEEFKEDRKAIWDMSRAKSKAKKQLKNDIKANKAEVNKINENSSMKAFNDARNKQKVYTDQMKAMGTDVSKLYKKYANSSEEEIRKKLGADADKVLKYKDLVQKSKEEGKLVREAKAKAQKDNEKFANDFKKSIQHKRSQEQLEELKRSNSFKMHKTMKKGEENETVDKVERIIAEQTAKADAKAKAEEKVSKGGNADIDRKLDKMDRKLDNIERQNKKDKK